MRPVADTLYIALVNDPARLRGLRRMQYRCDNRRRCLVLDAIEMPSGDVILHQKRYKLSPTLNAARSNEAGRARSTFDGDNHWMPRTYYIDASALSLTDAEGATLEVQCDHVLAPLKPSMFAEDWNKRHAEVRIRPDCSRYAVT